MGWEEEGRGACKGRRTGWGVGVTAWRNRRHSIDGRVDTHLPTTQLLASTTRLANTNQGYE